MSLKNRLWNIFHLIYRGRRAKVTVADIRAVMTQPQAVSLLDEALGKRLMESMRGFRAKQD